MPGAVPDEQSEEVTLNIASNSETVPTQNVVAVWEGSDPVLKTNMSLWARTTITWAAVVRNRQRHDLQWRGRRRFRHNRAAGYG